jgi:uncharacterized protein YcaQ
MSQPPLHVSLDFVRKLAVTKQHLQGPLPSNVTGKEILSVVRDLGYVQWDPITIVAPSHLISLWCRVGDFSPSLLEKLLWEDKRLMEHASPIAWLVPTEDFPLYESLMRRYPDSLNRSWGQHIPRAKRFLAQHAALRKRMLSALKAGPLQLHEFEDHLRTKRTDGEWTPASDVSQMLLHLQMSGLVMVVGHRGNQNLWGLTREFLPGWVPPTGLSEKAVERETAQRAIRALGTATAAEINFYFVRGRYATLPTTLADLERGAAIHRVVAEGLGEKEVRYVHDQDVALLEAGGARDWDPRVSLLPPFDNFIFSRRRMNRMFGFDYVREQFLPAAKRRYGTYVPPILWGDRLIGRIDPRLDKASGTLEVKAVYAEPGAPKEREVASAIADAILRFAAFLNATRVLYSSKVPDAWKGSLH